MLSAQRTGRKKYLLKKILDNADRIVTVSQFNVEQLKKININPERIFLIPPGLTPPEAVTEEKLNDLRQRFQLADKKKLLTIGRLVARKGHDQVVRALPAVLKKIPNLVYIIAGDGDYRQDLERLVSQNNLENQVIFTGRVSETDKSALYDLADVFIMPSRQIDDFDVEGFGIVFLEAGHYGKPVIAGQSGGVADAVVDGQTGLLVDPENINEISQAIIKLLTDPELADKLGRQGQQRVIAEFNWKNQAAKLCTIL
ncbi:MAG TPA: glycosyltransferase family 4 protein [Patescibacteria group bacterium]